jgi:hypothetical protein
MENQNTDFRPLAQRLKTNLLVRDRDKYIDVILPPFLIECEPR